MKWLNDGWKKYLLLVPILFLLVNALYFKKASQEINRALLEKKYNEVVAQVNMLAASVEADEARTWQEHERNIIDSVEYLDKQYQVYAVAYVPDERGLELITRRHYETSPFNPFEYGEFKASIKGSDSGKITIGYTPENQVYRDLHIYYRWMPVYSSPAERYLVVGGVSEHSVTVPIAEWVSMGQIISMLATFAINMALILLVIRLGRIYDRRGGDKWRGEDGVE